MEKCLLLAGAVAVGLAATAMCQNLSSSSINGTVTDSSGAVIPDATVVATSSGLQVGTLSTKTDKSGLYRFIDLPSGKYSLRFEHDGFRPLVRNEIVLDANFSMRLDTSLVLGTTSKVSP